MNDFSYWKIIFVLGSLGRLNFNREKMSAFCFYQITESYLENSYEFVVFLSQRICPFSNMGKA